MSYVSDRLGINAGDRVLLLNAPRGYLGTLWPVPEDVTVSGDSSHHPFDVLQAFIETSSDLRRLLDEGVPAAGKSRTLWVSLPTSDSGREREVTATEITTELHHSGWEREEAFTLNHDWRAYRFTPLDSAGRDE